jgi:hypothetical protein
MKNEDAASNWQHPQYPLPTAEITSSNEIIDVTTKKIQNVVGKTIGENLENVIQNDNNTYAIKVYVAIRHIKTL